MTEKIQDKDILWEFKINLLTIVKDISQNPKRRRFTIELDNNSSIIATCTGWYFKLGKYCFVLDKDLLDENLNFRKARLKPNQITHTIKLLLSTMDEYIDEKIIAIRKLISLLRTGFYLELNSRRVYLSSSPPYWDSLPPNSSSSAEAH